MLHKIKCKKSLYKSTYKGNAFTKDLLYTIVDEDKLFVYVIDDKGNEFSMSKIKKEPFYYIDEFFLYK